MKELGGRSQKIMKTLHPDLQDVINYAINILNLTLLEGHIGKEKQNEYYATGKSKHIFGESLHSLEPSEAVDLALLHEDSNPVRLENKFEQTIIAGMLIGMAFCQGVMLGWGGDANSDFTENDSFIERTHFYLKAKKIGDEWVSYKKLRESIDK